MTETTVGRETVQIVELLQPFCANTFGVAPCTASGPDDLKCYNTRGTCQDAENFSLGTPLSLFFSRGHVAERDVPGAGYIFPYLMSVSTAPTKINLAGSDGDAQGIGQRAVCTITLKDAPHTDRIVDPYIDGRSWNPMDGTRGTFWSRWLARNKYRTNLQIVVYEGYAGQSLSEMTKRRYFLTDTPQFSKDRITFKGKDPLARLEERKTQIPPVSPGLLHTGISAASSSFEVTRSVEADYPATGTLRINDEIMTYTGRSASSNGVTFTGVTRGTDNTSATSHSVDDAVQECRRYSSVSVDEALESICLEAGIDAAWLDTANWATEISDHRSLYDLTTLVTEPEAATSLVSQIHEQCGVYIWWDERDSLIKLKAIRGIDFTPPLLTDGENIRADNFRIVEKPKQRVSQTWIYYNQTDFTKKWDDQEAYQPQFVLADLDSETPEKYGEKSIRKIYARWLPTAALAQTTASRTITRYTDVPRQAIFQVDAKDRSLWVSDVFTLEHYLDVDQYGARRQTNWTIISAEEKRPGEVIEYVAEDTTLNGRIYYIMAAGTADYPGATAVPFRNAYIGDASGLLSDGSDCARIT